MRKPQARQVGTTKIFTIHRINGNPITISAQYMEGDESCVLFHNEKNEIVGCARLGPGDVIVDNSGREK